MPTGRPRISEPRNVLFVLYHDFTANSAAHVFALANELDKLACNCVVAVPSNKQSLHVLGEARFHAVEFEEALHKGVSFPDGRGPDVVHAWTPRENVRAFCAQLKQRYSFSQFVHLEDNEWHITARTLGRDFRELRTMSASDLDHILPANLSHPHRGAAFLREACGITLIIERLRELAPSTVPAIELWPSADPQLFSSQPLDAALRSKYRIPANCFVLAYVGNVHGANAHEVRSLYLAVAILNREGMPTTLVRAGRDFCPFLGADDSWARRHSIELGYVPHTKIPEVLALADLFVQPGAPDEFNDYRFPSKVPEYLAAGRPVVLPGTNIGLHMRHLQDAFILSRVDALAIVDAVRVIHGDPALYKRLACGGRAFFEKRLSWAASGTLLLDFYRTVLGKDSSLNGEHYPYAPSEEQERAAVRG